MRLRQEGHKFEPNLGNSSLVSPRFQILKKGQAWWYTPVILVLGRLRDGDCLGQQELGHLDNKVRAYLREEKKKNWGPAGV